MELTINLQDASKLQSLFALLNTFTVEQRVGITVQYAHNDVVSLPVSEDERTKAWLNIQEIVRRNKLRTGEIEMSPEDEEMFILQEIKAARAEERSQI